MPGRHLDLVWPADFSGTVPRKFSAARKYHPFIPAPLHKLDLRLDSEAVSAISEAECAVRELNATSHSALAPLARLLLRTESIASSKIEGMQVGVQQLARAEAKQAMAQRVGPEAERILANIATMQIAVDEAANATPFDITAIQTIHRRLMQGDPNYHSPGELRTTQNWIGGNDFNPVGADFIPPPPGQVAPLLADLCACIESDTLAPVVQAALVHAQFETIHPFGDGNGRTGRALIHVVLRRRGVARTFVPPISLVFAAGKSRYITGLTAFRGDAVGEWVAQFAAATTRAARLAESYLARVETLRATWRERLRAHANPRSDAAAWRIIDELPAHPIISAAAAVAATARDKSSVSKAFEMLIAAGVLQSASEGKRNQFYAAPELLRLIEQMELSSD